MTRSRDVADTQDNLGGAVAPFVAGKNALINGGMDIWQRGTSFGAGVYTADRWIVSGSGGSQSVTRSTDVPTNPYFNYSLSMVGTSSLNTQIYQRIESVNATYLAGRTVTLSVWAKNVSGTTPLSYVGAFPAGVDNFASITVDVVGNLTANSWSGSWTRYSVTFTVSAAAVAGYSIILYRNGTETSTTLLTGVQLELGALPTPFSRTGGSIGGELALCQRYYERRNALGAYYGMGLSGRWTITTSGNFAVNFAVPKRTTPSLAFSNLNAVVGNSQTTISSMAGPYPSGQSNNVIAGDINFTSSSGVTGYATTANDNGSGTGYIEFSAEL